MRAIEDGSIVAWTSSLVIAEIVFVLENRKTYNIARTAIRDNLLPLLMLPGLRLERKTVYRRVFDLYVSSPIDYIDAYHVALLEHYDQHELYSFDRDFDAVAGLTRIEPPGTSE
jgi:predicted nucleic acid-binding protein